jgi:hypothetical protein
MFKNHSIQMRLVKPSQTADSPDTPETNIADLAYIATETSNSMLKGVGALMLSYVAADTARKIIVHIATTKIK